MRREASTETQRNAANVQIRIATPSDAAAIAAVLFESFIEFRQLYTIEGFAATTPTAEQIRKRIDEGLVWVAETDDKIEGTVSSIPKGDSLYIQSMAILPSARGRGIGKLLFSKIESLAEAGDYRRLFLSTTPFLKSAIGLYEHFGFQLTAEGPHDLYGTPLFTMEKLWRLGD